MRPGIPGVPDMPAAEAHGAGGVLRTPLSYFGGKQMLASRIVALMGEHYMYVEPFVGGAAVLFAKPRSTFELLNDADGRIVRFWRAVRDRPEELARAVRLTPYSRAEWRECDKWRRDASPDPEPDDVEVGRRLLVAVVQSFQYGMRAWAPPPVKSVGVWRNLPDRIAAASERLAGVALECGDGVALIQAYDRPGVLFYCDPPYPMATRRDDAPVYSHDDDGRLWPRLLDALADVRHAQVILSSYESDEINQRLFDWRSLPLAFKRSYGGLTGAASMTPERVWLSPNLKPPQGTLFDAHDI